MKTSVLLASVGAGVGTLGGGGALAYHLLPKETVSVVLTKKGYEFLSFEEGKDLDTWKEIGKAYANSEKNRLTGLTIAKPASSNKATEQEAKALKKICKDLVNSSNFKDSDLLTAEQWCVKPITIEELIKKHKKILSLDKSKDLEQEAWNTKVDAYLTDGAKNKLSKTTLTNPKSADKKTDRNKLRDDCNNAKDKKTYDDDFHDNYAPFNEWCTIPKVNG